MLRCQMWVKVKITTQKLKTKLNAKIKVCGVQSQIVMFDYVKMIFNEDEGDIGFEEFMMILQPAEPEIMKDAKIKKMILELQEKANKNPMWKI